MNDWEFKKELEDQTVKITLWNKNLDWRSDTNPISGMVVSHSSCDDITSKRSRDTFSISIFYWIKLYAEQAEEVIKNTELGRIGIQFDNEDHHHYLMTEDKQHIVKLLEVLQTKQKSISEFMPFVIKELEKGDIAKLFGLIVLLSDNYFKLSKIEKPAEHFFKIVTELPLELQMTMCNRWKGFARDLVPVAESEPAFKDIAIAEKNSVSHKS